MKRLIAICAVALFANNALSATDDGQTELRILSEDLVARAEADKVVGGTFAAYNGGKEILSTQFGYFDNSEAQPIDKDTIFHWASITKTLTAISVMQLVERDLISLDDPVTKYIPEFWHAHNPYGSINDVTIRHLLDHTSGLRSPTWPWNADGAENSAEWQRHEPLFWSQLYAMMPYTGIQFEPGTRYSYSNIGSSLLGKIVEIVTGDHIEVFVEKNIFKPLGMRKSYFDMTPYHLQQFRPNNYTWRGEKLVDHGSEFDTSVTSGNGGLNAPVGDMALYMNFLLGMGNSARNEAVLKRKTLEGMWEPGFKTEYDPLADEWSASTFFVINSTGVDDRQRKIIGHTGSQRGYRSFLYVHPDSGTAVIWAVTTTDSEEPRPLQYKSRQIMLEKLMPLLEKDGHSK